MTSKTWSAGTVIDSPWLQDVNDVTYFANSQTGKAKLQREMVSVWDYFTSSSFDPSQDANYAATTTAFNSAIATGKRVYVPAGTYVVEDVALLANTEIYGEGWKSIIKQRASAASNHFCFAIGQNAAADATSIAQYQNVYIHDLQFLGRVATEAFSQFVHLVSLNNVKDAVVERCFFNGFKGDGLYIGSGILGNELHNRNVIIRDCFFDGVINDNRNGISVVDINGILITGTSFRNCTRSNMPGAIDIEPDASATRVINDVKILNNKFYNTGGNTGTIGVFIPAACNPATKINISGNTFDNSITSTTHADIYVVMSRNPANSDPDSEVIISKNAGKTGSRPFLFQGFRGITMEGNAFDNYTQGSYIGYTAATDTTNNCKIINNTFTRIGTTGQIGLTVYNANYLTIEGNLFDDCGNGAAGSYALDFGTTAASTYVTLRNNIYRSPTAKTLVGVQKEGSHTFTSSTNRHLGCIFLDSLTNSFVADENDVKSQTFTPVVEGSTAVGAGTYTTQEGVYRYAGNRVWFSIKLVWTAHTGTGNTLISIPKNTAGGASVIPVDIISETIAYTASRFPAAFVSPGNQRINLYQFQSGGASGAIAVPAAGTLYLSGSYPTA